MPPPVPPSSSKDAQDELVDHIDRLMKAVEAGDVEAKAREIHRLVEYVSTLLSHIQILMEDLEAAGGSADRPLH